MLKSICLFFLLAGTATLAFAQAEAPALYKLDKVHEVHIQFDHENWDDILDSMKQSGLEERLLADVRFDGETFKGAGVRYKGNSSYFSVRKYDYAKLPFNIDVNETEQGHKLDGGYDKLKLSNVFRDPSFLREALSYQIANKYMVSPRANFVKVFINDKYFGLYSNAESIDDELLDQYFGEHDGVLFKCDPAWGYEAPASCPEGDKASLQYLGQDSACYMGKYELKSDHGWAELIALTDILNNRPEKLDSVFAVDEALWMLAFNSVLVNLDSYTGRFCHNYYLYQDQAGVFHPIIWDLNLSFGGFRYDGLGKPLTLEDMQTLSPFIHYKQKNEKRPLITQLLADDLYRKMYIAHIKTIVEDNFLDSTYLHEGRKLQSLIREHVVADTNRLYEVKGFEKNLYETAKADKVAIVGIAELMEARKEYLLSHPLVSKPQPVVEEVECIDLGSGSLAVAASISGAEAAWLFYRYGKTGAFRKLPLLDDGAHADEMQADGVFANILENAPAGEELQYYIVGENQYAASLSPERASFEYHTFPIKK